MAESIRQRVHDIVSTPYWTARIVGERTWNWFTTDRPIGHGIAYGGEDENRFFFERGPWWLLLTVRGLHVVDLLTAFEWISTLGRLENQLKTRYGTTEEVPIALRHVPAFRRFIGVDPWDWGSNDGLGPYEPNYDSLFLRFGAHWHCTGCGTLSVHRDRDVEAICSSCGTELMELPVADELPVMDDLREALSELTEYELASEPTAESYYCAEHDRYLPCRRCHYGDGETS